MRAFFLDRIRVILTLLVIAHHSAITYGASGDWFVKLAPGDGPTALGLTLFVAVNQAFVLGYFFLLAGYLTPPSFDRKGWAAYTRDRLLRLGLPLLVFGFLIGPLTVAIASDGIAFPAAWRALVMQGRFVVGPMWFALALLVFSLAYVIWRRTVPVRVGPRRPVPGHLAWIAAALAVGCAALVIRQVSPVGETVFGLQPAYFASYIFLFALGCVAERYGWVERVKQRHAVPWLIAAIVAVPVLPAVVLWGGGDARTGFTLSSIVYAFWEPVVAGGLIGGSLWYFEMRFSERDRRWGFLSRQSYGAFILHPPVLVTLALVLNGLPLPAVVKFVLLTAGGAVVSFSLSWTLRKLPFVRNVI
jgi:fucose 4-O-acetylase-like acetyltransferase